MNLTAPNVVNTAVGLILNKYPMVTLDTTFDHHRDRLNLNALIESPDGQRWSSSTYLEVAVLLRYADASREAVLVDLASTLIQDLINSVPIEVIGAYPFARIWHDFHDTKSSSIAPLLWYPERLVPGWVFSKAYKQYPRDQSAKAPSPKLNEVSVDDSDSKFRWDDVYDKMKEALTVASTTKKKKVIRRAPVVGFDPSKVRAPDCMKHGTPMVFDMVAQKWRCTEDGCRVVARPARDEDDKTVILGKGGLQLRLVAQDGGLSVVLISDDNIALDITKMVDVDEIIDTFDVKEQAKVALESGKEVFAAPTEKHITLNSRLVVMGATELTE